MADNFDINLLGNPTLSGTGDPKPEWYRDSTTITTAREDWAWSGESDVITWTRPSAAGAAHYYGPAGAGAINRYAAVGKWVTIKARAMNYGATSGQRIQLQAGGTILGSPVVLNDLDWQDVQISAQITAGLETEPLLWVMRWEPYAGGSGTKPAVVRGSLGLYVTDTDPSTWEPGGGGEPCEPPEPPPFAPAGPRLYRDRVTLYVGADPAVVVPAQVVPLGVDAAGAADDVFSRYRVLLAPRVEIGLAQPADVKIGWGPYVLTDGGDARLVASGVERHYRRGRLHHYEVITAARG